MINTHFLVSFSFLINIDDINQFALFTFLTHSVSMGSHQSQMAKLVPDKTVGRFEHTKYLLLNLKWCSFLCGTNIAIWRWWLFNYHELVLAFVLDSWNNKKVQNSDGRSAAFEWKVGPLKVCQVHFVAPQVLDEVLPEFRELFRRQLLRQVEGLPAVVFIGVALPEVARK